METNISNAVQMVLHGEKIGFDDLLFEFRAEMEKAVEAIGCIDQIAILKHHCDYRWQMILPDVSGGDRWRTQSFDTNGFSGHCVFATKQKAIRNAASMRFIIRDDEALDRLQDTPEFQIGLYAIEQIALHNSGQIDFKEYSNRIVIYRKQILEATVQ